MQRRRRRRPQQGYYYDDYGPMRRAVRRPFLQALTPFITTITVMLLSFLVVWIALNFQTFLVILHYTMYVGIILLALLLIYVVIRILNAISLLLSQGSVARARARQEREKARQTHVHVQMEKAKFAQQARLEREQIQQARFAREERKYRPEHDAPEQLRRTRVLREIREEEQPVPPRRTRVLQEEALYYNEQQESRYRTRVLREPGEIQQPLVRVLHASTTSAPPPEPTEVSALELIGMPAKGQVFAYRDYKKYLQSGQLIIGIRKDGTPRIGSWEDFKIMLILGSSSSGKSTTVLEKCLCIVGSGGQLVICDPGGFKPDSLTRRLGSLQTALLPGTSVALEHEDIMQNVESFRDELEERRRGADMTTPILLVIDELNGVLMDKTVKKALTELLEKFAQQARGYNMYMILCAQRASGLAAIRNSVISFVCHKCPEMEAEKIIPARYARLASQLGVGQTFVSDANGLIEPLQQIFITPEDITSSVGGTASPHRHRTEPMAPPRYGAASPQKLVVRKTSLVQSVSPQQPPAPVSPQQQQGVPRKPTSYPSQTVSNPSTVQRPNGGAIWGEEPSNLPLQRTPPNTEKSVPRRASVSRQSPDPFETLTTLRDQQRKKQ